MIRFLAFLLAFFPSCLGCRVPNMAEAFGLKPQKLTVKKGADGTWIFEAGTDFDGSGELAVSADGSYTFRMFNWSSLSSPVTLAQGQAAATAGIQEAMKQNEETRRLMYGHLFGTINRVVDMIPAIAPLLASGPTTSTPLPESPPIVLPIPGVGP